MRVLHGFRFIYINWNAVHNFNVPILIRYWSSHTYAVTSLKHSKLGCVQAKAVSLYMTWISIVLFLLVGPLCVWTVVLWQTSQDSVTWHCTSPAWQSQPSHKWTPCWSWYSNVWGAGDHMFMTVIQYILILLWQKKGTIIPTQKGHRVLGSVTTGAPIPGLAFPSLDVIQRSDSCPLHVSHCFQPRTVRCKPLILSLHTVTYILSLLLGWC